MLVGKPEEVDHSESPDDDRILLTLKSRMVQYVPTMNISHSAFCIYGFFKLLGLNCDYFLNSIIWLIFLMVNCGVLFEVRTEFFNII
jgi:hypothetical protein